MTTAQQITAQAVVGAMAVSIMSTAMGIMIAALGPAALKVAPEKVKGVQAAVGDLKLAFGGTIVDQAVKNVGTDSMIVLAQEVERLVIEDMNKKYGEQATQSALMAAPPGDMRAAVEIAKVLSGQGVTAATPPAVQQRVMAAAKMKGRQAAQPVKDTKTGIVYKSKSAAGMAVAAEYGLDSKETFVWYQVIEKDPTRFVRVSAAVAPKA